MSEKVKRYTLLSFFCVKLDGNKEKNTLFQRELKVWNAHPPPSPPHAPSLAAGTRVNLATKRNIPTLSESQGPTNYRHQTSAFTAKNHNKLWPAPPSISFLVMMIAELEGRHQTAGQTF